MNQVHLRNNGFYHGHQRGHQGLKLYENVPNEDIQEFLYQYNLLRKQGFNKTKIQLELTKLGYPPTIVEDWASVDYSYEWVEELLGCSRHVES